MAVSWHLTPPTQPQRTPLQYTTAVHLCNTDTSAVKISCSTQPRCLVSRPQPTNGRWEVILLKLWCVAAVFVQMCEHAKTACATLKPHPTTLLRDRYACMRSQRTTSSTLRTHKSGSEILVRDSGGSSAQRPRMAIPQSHPPQIVHSQLSLGTAAPTLLQPHTHASG